MHDTPPSVPDFTQWPSFPFEGDLRVKRLDDPVPVEPPRKGEAHRECTACQAPDDAYIWVGERWRVRAMDRPTGLPMVLILESRSHLDLGDLPNLLAAELGVMTVRLERAIRSLDGVARVHVNRWGDGSAHLHMWFLARPYGRLQLRGTFLSLWDSILPPISEEKWRENLALVAAWLAEFGGRPLAEPPRIQWQAPSSLAAQSAPSEGQTSTGGGSLLDVIGETAEPPDPPEELTAQGGQEEPAAADTAEPDGTASDAATAEAGPAEAGLAPAAEGVTPEQEPGADGPASVPVSRQRATSEATDPETGTTTAAAAGTESPGDGVEASASATSLETTPADRAGETKPGGPATPTGGPSTS
ncbi:hypothetical protein ACQPYA_31375 [Micromonospora sp. CA-263727]|uniref:hypothetical protein n=1 Tax=Micromonospora sp. CA-263727 TaxID=3239967 RepID=UPI003D8C8269